MSIRWMDKFKVYSNLILKTLLVGMLGQPSQYFVQSILILGTDRIDRHFSIVSYVTVTST